MDKKKTSVVMGGGGWHNIVAPDAAFSFLPFNIQKLGDSFRVDPTWSIEALAPTGKAYYVATDGDDGNDGLAWATPLRKVSTALNKADVVEVHIAEGIYSRGYGWENTSPARDIAVYGYGDVILSPFDAALSWSAVDSHYTASSTACNNIIDASIVDVNGDYQTLIKKANEAEVEATPGSWWYDTVGDIIYIRTSDSRAPDSDIWCNVYTGNGQLNDPNTYYVENIKFYAGSNAFSASEATGEPKLYFKNCEFKYSSNGNGLDIEGCHTVIAQDCIAACNIVDGFKAEELSTMYCNLILIDCISRSNGYLIGATENCNGYSRHDRGSTVIINSEMFNNYGRNIQDINAGAGGGKLWCLGTYNHDSSGTTPTVDLNFSVAGADAKMWLDTCISSGGAYDVEAGADAVVYLRKLTGSATNIATGTITSY